MCLHAFNKSHIEIVDGLCHIELVHGVDNDGWSCEECEQQEKGEVDQQAAHEPAKTPHWQIGPAAQENNRKVTQKQFIFLFFFPFC